MATHALFQGGNRTNVRFPASMFPQKDVLPDQFMQPDHRGRNNSFVIPRRLIWNDTNDKCGVTFDSVSSQGLAQYLEDLETPIVVGDVIQLAILPKEFSLERVWIKVNEACPGLTFSVRIRGNAASLGGTPAVPVPQTLVASVNGGITGSALTVLAAPLYLNQNDMLEMVITGLGPQGIACSDVVISPLIQGYCGHHGHP